MKKIWLFLILVIVIISGCLLYNYFSPYGVNNSSDETVMNIAIQKNDISICDKIHLKGFGDVTYMELQGRCYLEYAKIYPQENVCPRLLLKEPDKSTVEGNAEYTTYKFCLKAQGATH
jgi:hypothetical protein